MRNKFNKAQEKLVNFIIDSPVKTLLVFLVFTLLLSAGAIGLKSDFSYKVWYNPKDPLMELYKKFERNFGNDDSVIIGINNQKGIFNQEVLNLINKLTDDLYQVRDVIRVDSVLNFHDISANGDQIDIEPLIYEDEIDSLSKSQLLDIKKKALENKILVNSLIDEEATFTVINAQLRPAHDDPPNYQLITEQVVTLMDKYKKLNPEIEFVAIGPVILTDAFRAITVSDIMYLIPFLYSLFTVVLIVLFRSFSGVVLPYIAIASSTVLMLGTMGFLGLSINTLTSTAPTILMTVALADAIHILTVFFLGLRRGLNNEQALRGSLIKNFYPTILTTITTSLGFLSFFDAKVQPVADLGIAVGLGAVFAWLSSYMLLGPILALLPKFSKKPHMKEAETFLKEVTPHNRSLAFADFIIDKKYFIVFAAIVLGSMGLFFSKDLVVNMDPLAQFRPSHPMVKAYNLVEEKLGFVGSIELVVQANEDAGAKDPKFLEKVEKFEQWLTERPYVTSVLSINDYLKKINQAFNSGDPQYHKIPPTSEHVAQELLFYSMGLPPEQPIENRINAQRDAIRVTVKWKLKDSLNSNKQFELINKKAQEFGLNAKVTGKTPLFHDLTPYIVSAFTHSFTLAVVTISLALWFIFQSFRLSIFAMIPSLLPLSIGAGLYALTGYQVDMGTALVASVCLGIAVDDSVHFLFAYRSLIKEKSFRETLADIISNVYPSLFNTTLLLAMGFSVLLLGNYIPNAKFGACVSIVLIIALISDFLVLPAILAILHKKKGRS